MARGKCGGQFSVFSFKRVDAVLTLRAEEAVDEISEGKGEEEDSGAEADK